MRILNSGDHHFDQHRRLDECVAVHEEMVDVARREKVDLFLSGGDVYERASSAPEREAASEWLIAIAEVCPIVIANGNHDRPFDARIMRKLKTRHPILVEERAAVHYVAGAAVATVAWPERSNVMAMLDQSVAAAVVDGEAHHALQSVLRGLGDQMEDHDGPRILLGHFMCDGAIASTGQPLLGLPLNVTLMDLSLARPHLALMSHIHKAQKWEFNGATYLYSGSPYRTDFSQLEKKIITLATFDGQRLVSLDEIPTSCSTMLHVDGQWASMYPDRPETSGDYTLMTRPEGQEEWGIGSMPGVGGTMVGAEVRLRYRVSSDRRDAAKRAAREWERIALEYAKAKSVKIEEQVIPITRARAPEIAAAIALPDKLEALWRSQRQVPDGSRRRRLLEKLSELELECEVKAARLSSAGAVALHSVSWHNLGPFKDFEINLSDYQDALLIALCGENGAGKSFALESAFGGAMYRKMPTQGTLMKRAAGRDCWLESTIGIGADKWEIRHTIDSIGKEQLAFVKDGAGKPVLSGASVSGFDAWSKLAMPDPDIFYMGAFSVQGSSGFLKLNPVPRKAALLRVIGVEQVEKLAVAAGKHARDTQSALTTVLARIEDEHARSGDVVAARTALDEAKLTAVEAEAALEQARDELRAARAAAVVAELASWAAAEVRARRDVLQAQLGAERAKAAVLEAIPTPVVAEENLAAARAAEAAAAVVLSKAKAALEEARSKNTQYEIAARDAQAALDRRTELQIQLRRQQKEIADLDSRIAKRRAILAEGDEIRAALAKRDELARRTLEIEAEEKTSAERKEAIRKEVDRCKAAISAGTARFNAAMQRAARARERLVDRDAIEAAVLALPAKREAVRAAYDAACGAEGRLADVRSESLVGAQGRIDGLRGSLTDIQDADDLMGSDPMGRLHDVAHQARETLRTDDHVVASAAEQPTRLQAAECDLREAKLSLTPVERELAACELLAARTEEMEQVSRDASEAEADAVAAQRDVEAATDAGADAMQEGSEQPDHGAFRAEAAIVLAGLAPLLEKAEPLAMAPVQLADWEPRLGAALAEIARLTAEVDATPEPGPLPEVWDLDRLDLMATGAEAKARSAATAIAMAEQRLIEARDAAPKLEAARAEEIRLASELAGTPEPAPAPATPDVGPLEAALSIADGYSRGLAARLSLAEQTFTTAQAGEARLNELTEQHAGLDMDLSDWTRLADDLGRDGLQAMEIDAAGPELTELVNDLLRTCVGSRWTISIETTKLNSEGKQVEGCEVRVLDTVDGRDDDAANFSFGQRALLNDAMELALSMLSCKRSGFRGGTLIRDETGAPLDPANARAYVAMLRRAATLVDASKVILVTHSTEVVDMADARIEIPSRRNQESAPTEETTSAAAQ